VLNENGKLMFDNEFCILESPCGNGDFYEAMKLSGILTEMKSKNIKFIFCMGVDNCLCKIADPFMIGNMIKNEF